MTARACHQTTLRGSFCFDKQFKRHPKSKHHTNMLACLQVGFFHGYLDGVDWVFVDHPSFHGFANNIYGGNRQDITFRCALLCKAALEAVWHVQCGGAIYGDENLIYIANDWHTALLPTYLQVCCPLVPLSLSCLSQANNLLQTYFDLGVTCFPENTSTQNIWGKGILSFGRHVPSWSISKSSLGKRESRSL